MGEKFDTPTGVVGGAAAGAAAGAAGGQSLAMDMSASHESTTTEERPVTKEKEGTGRDYPRGQNPEGKKGTWSGEDKYPDGYKMMRHDDGTITLTDPDGEMGIWQDGKWTSWRTGGGDMPEGWGGGHEPGKG